MTIEQIESLGWIRDNRYNPDNVYKLNGFILILRDNNKIWMLLPGHRGILNPLNTLDEPEGYNTKEDLERLMKELNINLIDNQ
jgi:hypothetical protein